MPTVSDSTCSDLPVRYWAFPWAAKEALTCAGDSSCVGTPSSRGKMVASRSPGRRRPGAGEAGGEGRQQHADQPERLFAAAVDAADEDPQHVDHHQAEDQVAGIVMEIEGRAPDRRVEGGYANGVSLAGIRG